MVFAPGVAFSVAESTGTFTAYEVMSIVALTESVYVFLTLGVSLIFRMRNGETTGPPRRASSARRPGPRRYTARR